MIGVGDNGNTADSNGGGVYVGAAGAPLLTLDASCEFWDNTALNGNGGHAYLEVSLPTGSVACATWPASLEFNNGSALNGGTLAWDQGTLDLSSGPIGYPLCCHCHPLQSSPH